mmetsp:Transcript_4707/g.9397  ORF Transcript_4707/g.9397 Transcript_4707/m.9397 type:complete len:111 (-) Transcript_4707:196-528(-)
MHHKARPAAAGRRAGGRSRPLPAIAMHALRCMAGRHCHTRTHIAVRAAQRAICYVRSIFAAMHAASVRSDEQAVQGYHRYDRGHRCARGQIEGPRARAGAKLMRWLVCKM